MKTIKYLSITFAVVLAFVLAMFSGFGVRKLAAQLSPVKSFQVWVHVSNSLNEQRDEFVARAPNGDKLTTDSANGLSILTLPSKGIKVLYSSGSNYAMTAGNGAATVAEDYPNCNVLGLLAESKNILGIDTQHFVNVTERLTAHSAAEKDTIDFWAAPSLDCYPLAVEYTFSRNGVIYHRESKAATRVIVGPPPEDLFKVPTGKQEVPPSVFWPEIRQPYNPKVLKAQDEQYANEKQQREQFRLP